MTAAKVLSLAAGLLLTAPLLGGMVETKDGRVWSGRVRVEENGGVAIQMADGQTQRVALAQIRLAQLQESVAGAGKLPRGWRAEEIGGVQGVSGESQGGQFLRVSGGTVKDTRQQAAYLVHRVLHADGEVSVRLRELSGSNTCAAGVMMRENLETTGGFVLLAVSPDRRLLLASREAGWRNLEQRWLGPATLPLWLKLVRQHKSRQVTAFTSANGSDWRQVGQTPLNCRTEPFPEASDQWRPAVHVGVALTSPGAGPEALARFDKLDAMAEGLMGEYFLDSRFRSLRFARPDPKIEFHWGEGSPLHDIPADHFGVRWTGVLEPRVSGTYLFHVDADNDATLWLDGKEIKTGNFRKESKPDSLPLVGGRKYRVKLEYREGAGAASVKLGWTSPRQPLEVIAAPQLSCPCGPEAPVQEVDVEDAVTNAFSFRGLRLCQGSFIAGQVRSGDDAVFKVAFAGQEDFPVPRSKTALLVLRPARAALALPPEDTRTGVVLRNGDFLDAAFAGLQGRSLTMSSALFGRRTYSLDDSQVAAVVLQPGAPRSAALCEVRLKNGSRLRLNALRAESGVLRAEDTSLGEIALPVRDLIEIRAAAPSE